MPITLVTIVYMYFVGRRLLPEGGEVPEKFLAELDPMQHNVPKQVIAGLILVGCMVVMCLDLEKITVEMAAVVGALICVLSGCLTEKQAYHSIEWSTIFLFAGMMPVSHALYNTGAAELLARWMLEMLGGTPGPLVVTAVIFIVTALLTQFMSNSASVMSIAVASSCAFATPIGTPPCTLMVGPGHYRFVDYIKAGLPLIILCFAATVIIVPLVWPF